MESERRFTYLLEQYTNKTIINNEQTEFMQMVASRQYDEILKDWIDRSLYAPSNERTEGMSFGKAQQVLMAISKSDEV